MMGRRERLRRLLCAFEPRDELESAHRDDLLALLEGPGDPFARDHFDPGHVTASAFVLSPDRASVLLIEHAKLDRWLQPGGHVEPGDATILAAAQREVEEEVALAELPSVLGGAPLDLDVHEIPARKTDPAHRHYDVRFLLQAPGRAVRAGDDALAVRWVRLEEVSGEASDESVMRAVRKIRGITGA